MSAAVVHYIKVDGTKGSVELVNVKGIDHAIAETRAMLLADAVDNDEISADDAKSSFAPLDVATITKAEIVDSVQAYAGHRSSL